MLYEYHCECGHTKEEVRPVDERDTRLECSCGRNMTRFKIPRKLAMSFGTFKPGYNPAFGKTFETKLRQDEEIARINGETGRNLIEVGTEKPKAEKKRSEVDLKQVYEALNG